jgi:hypothetical protein
MLKRPKGDEQRAAHKRAADILGLEDLGPEIDSNDNEKEMEPLVDNGSLQATWPLTTRSAPIGQSPQFSPPQYPPSQYPPFQYPPPQFQTPLFQPLAFQPPQFQPPQLQPLAFQQSLIFPNPLETYGWNDESSAQNFGISNASMTLDTDNISAEGAMLYDNEWMERMLAEPDNPIATEMSVEVLQEDRAGGETE